MDGDVLSAFNDAVSSGSSGRIETAALALMNEAMANPSDPDATVAAFEASLKLAEQEECAAAIPGADFAMRQQATASHPLMEDRRVLLAYARYCDDSTSESRSELEASLMNVTEPSMLTLRAWVDLYTGYGGSSRWRDAVRTASAAADHMRPFKSSIPQLYFNATESAAISHFMHEPSAEAHERLYRWQLEGEQYWAQVWNSGEDIPDWLEDTRWYGDAWMHAADMMYRSFEGQASSSNGRAVRNQLESMSDAQRASVSSAYSIPMLSRMEYYEPGERPLPFCRGRVNQTRELSYPSVAGWNMRVGTVIVRFTIDADGNVVEPELLAAVPPGNFEDRVLDTVSEWKFEVHDGQDLSQCRVAGREIYQTVGFYIIRR